MICFLFLPIAAAAASHAQQKTGPALGFVIDKSTGVYTVSVDGQAWYSSPASGESICVKGKQIALKLAATAAVSGTDKVGAWTGVKASFAAAAGQTAAVDYTFKTYAATPDVAVGLASFPVAIDTSGCGSNLELSTHFPSFDTAAGRAASLHTLSWRGGVIGTTAAAKGLGNLGANGLDCGPVASTDPTTGNTLVRVHQFLSFLPFVSGSKSAAPLDSLPAVLWLVRFTLVTS
jgi:hypothetical protein